MMATRRFNSAVIGSAYVFGILIPEETELILYRDVRHLIEAVERTCALENAKYPASQDYKVVFRAQMERLFPEADLQGFERSLCFYWGSAGRGVSVQEAWPYIEWLSDKLIGDQTLEI